MNKFLKTLSAGVTAVMLGSVITVSTSVVTAGVANAANAEVRADRKERRLLKVERNQNVRGERKERRLNKVDRNKGVRQSRSIRNENRAERRFNRRNAN